MYYILILTAVIGIAIQFSLTKVYQKKTVKEGEENYIILKRSFIFAFATSFTGLIYFLILNGFKIEVTVFSLSMALLLSAISIASSILAIVVLSQGEISIYTLFMMLGGMMLPFICGVIFWDENISIWRIIGLIILTIALYISSMKDKEKREKKNTKLFYILCILIFVLNGCNSIISKIHQVSDQAIDTMSFLVLTNLTTLVLVTMVLILMKIIRPVEEEREKKNDKSIILIMILYSVVSGTAFMLQLISAEKLDASLLYPLVTGGTIVFTSLFGRIFFKERLGKYILLSIILTMFSTILFIF